MKSKSLIILTAVILFLIPVAVLGQVAPTLGTTSSFALFTGTGAFDNLGASMITGNIGSNTYTPTGFPIPGTVIGNIYNASDAITTTAAADVLTAYAALTQAGAVLSDVLDGLTLNPGVHSTGAVAASLGAGQTLTLNGLGNPNSIFIIRIGGALTTGTFANIVLTNSADLCNVYWQVNGAFTLGDNSVFRGTLIATGAIHLLEASSLFGRGLSTGGAIDTHNNVVTIGTAPATPGAITGTSAQCPALSGQTYSIAAVTTATTYSWTVPTGWSVTAGAGTTSITATTGAFGENGSIAVTAGNGCGTSAASSLAVTILASCSLIADFTGTPLSVYIGSTVTFTDISTGTTGSTTYSWDFGTGASIATAATIGPHAVSYSTSGLKTVSLTITDGTSDTKTLTNYITVNPLLIASVSAAAAPPGAVCSGTSVTFTATPANGGAAPAYIWKKGGLTITGETGVTFTSSTLVNGEVITVEMTSNEVWVTGNPATSAPVTMIINPVPSAPATGTISQPTCLSATGSVLLSGLPAAGTWTVTESIGSTTITGTGTTATFSGLSANNYTFTVTDAAGCTSVASGNAIINTQPPTPVVTNQTISISTGSTFTVSPTGVPLGTTYTWTAPVYTGGVTGGSAQPVPQTNISETLTIPSGTGTATYTVTPTSGVCAGIPFTVIVTVSSSCIPVSIGTQPTDKSMCQTSGNTSFTVTPAGSAPFTYQWQYNNGGTWENVTNGNPAGAVYSNQNTATPGAGGITSSGTYQYRSYVTNCSGASNATSNTASLTVNAAPAVPVAGKISQPDCILPTGSVVISGLPSGSWTISPGTVSGSTASTTISGLATGTYNFTVTDAAGCISSASADVVINSPPVKPAAPTVTLIQPDCNVPLGTITVTAPTGPGMTYSIDGIDYTNTTGIFTMVPIGTYTVTAKNSDGCISKK